MRRILITPLVFVAWACKAAALVAVLFLVFGIFAPNFRGAGKSVVLDTVITAENRVLGVTRKYLFTTYRGASTTSRSTRRRRCASARRSASRTRASPTGSTASWKR